MDGTTPASSVAFFEMMQGLMPRAGALPWDVLSGTPAVHPVVFVHRVEGLAPGLYVLDRGSSDPTVFRALLSGLPRWQRPEQAPATLDLFLLEEGDARSFATFSSCRQTIAGDSAFSVAMLGLFAESLAAAPWLYRRLFWEAGVVGHALYMEAEAHGLRGTGIGCFFDDVVHETLGLGGDRLKDLYHFTVGGAIDDPRLTTRPGYEEVGHR